MARILIAEADAKFRLVLEIVVCGLGHEPVVAGEDRRPGDVDVLVLEPNLPSALAIAWALRRKDPRLPIVFTSIRTATPDVLAFEPVAYLVKPFRLAELGQALEAAVAASGHTV